MASVEVTGAAELAKILGQNMKRALQPAMTAVAAVLQGIIAPYPPVPTYRGNRWYERGYGPKWRRKDGTVVGRKTSQFLNRSWAVEPRGDDETLLTNRATYAPWVHISTRQPEWHKRTGWVSDEQAIQRAGQSGDIVRVIDDALRRILPTKE